MSVGSESLMSPQQGSGAQQGIFRICQKSDVVGQGNCSPLPQRILESLIIQKCEQEIQAIQTNQRRSQSSMQSHGGREDQAGTALGQGSTSLILGSGDSHLHICPS